MYRCVCVQLLVMYQAMNIYEKKHANTDVTYSTSMVLDVFLHTVYQGQGHKHDDVHRELKPLLVNTSVADEAILKKQNNE